MYLILKKGWTLDDNSIQQWKWHTELNVDFFFSFWSCKIGGCIKTKLWFACAVYWTTETKPEELHKPLIFVSLNDGTQLCMQKRLLKELDFRVSVFFALLICKHILQGNFYLKIVDLHAVKFATGINIAFFAFVCQLHWPHIFPSFIG